jgi:hypothetical protein
VALQDDLVQILPGGTLVGFTYLNVHFHGTIQNGRIRLHGQTFDDWLEAAQSVGVKGWNAYHLWFVCRPDEREWQQLNTLRVSPWQPLNHDNRKPPTFPIWW